jgi:DNA-directed RNA polymerase subunit beta
MGDIPLMTNNGTFIVNGTERVIVSQMHRSPGVFFDHDKGKTHSSGKLLFAARIIPYRGSWLDIEFDAKDIVYARIDRRRKIPVTSLLYALGLDGEQILATFYKHVSYKRAKEGWRVPFDANRLKGYKAVNDLVDADTGRVVVEAGKKLTVRQALRGRGSGQRSHRRNLHGGRRGDHREESQDSDRGRLQGIAAARHRSRQCRRLHPQHAHGRQEHDA